MKLAYLACDKAGRQFTDTIDAPDPDSAVEQLRRKDLYVIEIGETDGSAPAQSQKPTKKLGRGRRLKETAVFTRQLAVLISSGTPMVEALGALHRQTKEGQWRDAISVIRVRVEEGASLSESMHPYHDYFDSAYCGMIAAGESSGNLVVMLERLAVLKKKQLHVRNEIIGALVYPFLLLFLSAGVLVLLLVFVVPRFADLFDTLDVPLPASTHCLVVVSSIFRAYWWLILAVLVLSVVATVTWLRRPQGKRFSDTVVLHIPRIGNIVKSFAVARITRLLGVLLQGRVPVLEALSLTRQAAGNFHYVELVRKAEDLVSRGEPIHSAFGDTALIMPSICETIRSGERSGQIGPMLVHVADFLDDENDVILRSLTSIIEPVILVVLGVVVGVVAISLFMPLFDLTSMVQGGAG